MHRINLGVLAHVDAGKTTVTEGMLFHSGSKRAMGRVDDGTTTTDSMLLEQQRGMTIRAATVAFCWRGVKINLIDTPGHMDFIAEVERSLAVLDGVVLVLSAREGVQTQTRVIFDALRAIGMPVLLFVNKVDRIGVSIQALYAEVERRLTGRFVPMQRVTGEGTREARVEPLPLVDAAHAELLIERDEALLAGYLDGRTPTEEQLRESLRAGTAEGSVYPLYLGAALHDIGIVPLLDAVTELFAQRGLQETAPLSAYIYKVQWDAYDHKWAYLRVLQGTLLLRSKAHHVGHEAPVHIRGLLNTGTEGFVPAASIEAGDIGVLLDAPHVRTGDFLGVALPLPVRPALAEPLLQIGIAPQEGVTRPALLTALSRLTEEDPFLQLAIHPVTEEITLRLFGLLQREILESLLLERFSIRAAFTPMRTLYKEQPTEPVEAEIRIWETKNLHEAGVALRLEPLPPGTGNIYRTDVSFGALERSFQNGVEEGVRAGLLEGLGSEIVDTRVIFTDMDYSSVGSTPADYRRLAPEVVRKALSAVPLRRLEPWVRYSITAPTQHQRRVLAAISGLRATMEAVLYGEEEFTIEGEAPLDTTKDFAPQLLSMTQGQGMFQTAFLAYREA